MIDVRTNRLRALNNQIERLTRSLNDFQQREKRLSNWRLGSFVLLFLLGSFVFLNWGAVPWAVISIILLMPFIWTVRQHRKLEDSIKRYRLLLGLKQAQKARMTLDWVHIPLRQPNTVVKNHPFAIDLNLIGDRSLMHLIDVSITREGGQRLCDWLSETEPDPQRTIWRQEVVQELIGLPALRDKLILNAALAGNSSGGYQSGQNLQNPIDTNVKTQWSGEILMQWLGKDVPVQSLRLVLILLMILVPINLILLAGFYVGNWPPLWMGSWLLYGVIMISQGSKVGPIFLEAAYLTDSMRQLAAVFKPLEDRSFKDKPAIRELLQPLHKKGRRPSEQLKRANRLLNAAGLRINPIVAFMLNIFIPWDIFIAYRLSIFKRELASLVPEWLDLWYEIEALFGLANFGYLYPEARFASFNLESDDMIVSGGSAKGSFKAVPIKATRIGHPLIGVDVRVYNDFLIEDLGNVLIISGSNMSGKSTFLRTLGINICLAQAGAPALADSLQLFPFRIAASINIVDSLVDGFSFFYAEVRRLKALLDELQKPNPYPLFFMIDEIFRGTNNQERLIGSRSYVQALIGGYGTGAIATHDLALVQLADTDEAVDNAHFRDDVANGHMVFDYKLYPGPCPTTNALKIMELAGLPVDYGQIVTEAPSP